MLQLSFGGRQWLKALHLLFVCGWVGGAASLIIMRAANGSLLGGPDLHGLNVAIKTVDDLIIIPSALGSLFTGLAFSLLTSWGFFRHWWVAVKWVLTVVAILFGSFFLGPWVNGMTAFTAAQGGGAALTEIYQQYDKLNFAFGSVQLVTLAFMLVISYRKPWGKRN